VNKDILVERASHGLYMFLMLIMDKNNKKCKTYINPNICIDVINILEYINTDIQFLDCDISLNIELNTLETFSALDDEFCNVLFYNCTYGYNDIPIQRLKNLKSKFPKLVIVLDLCLLNYDNYLKFVNLDFIDLIIYSFGYSKHIDLNTGGIVRYNLSNNEELLEFGTAIDFDKWKPNIYENSYSNHSANIKSTYAPRYILANRDEISSLNRTINLRDTKASIKKTHNRKHILNYLDGYKHFMLPPEKYDWRLHFCIPDEILYNNLINDLNNVGLYYSNHYDNKYIKNLPKTDKVVRSIVNVLDDARQNEISII
jgi:hypothetical protein